MSRHQFVSDIYRASLYLLCQGPCAGSGAGGMSQKRGYVSRLSLCFFPLRPPEAGPAPPGQAGSSRWHRGRFPAVMFPKKTPCKAFYLYVVSFVIFRKFPDNPSLCDRILQQSSSHLPKAVAWIVFLRYLSLSSTVITLYNVPII